MSIPAEDIHIMGFHIEVMMSIQMEHYYSWEVRVMGYASNNTRDLRHYWLDKLLQRQLREFDRG